MNKVVKLSILILLLFLYSCAGSGTKLKPKIRSAGEDKNYSYFYFSRDKNLLASGGTIEILFNGKSIGTLGIGEYLVHKSQPGRYTLHTDSGNLAGFGMGGGRVKGSAKAGGNYFFLVSYKQSGLFTAEWDIVEVTKNSFK